MDTDQIAQVRYFNRTVTQRLGVLNGNYLDSGRPLAEARLLFEIGKNGATVRDLRTRLGLDSGYLSRLLRVLEKDGLVASMRDDVDARVRKVRLTAEGERTCMGLEKRSQERAAALLAPLAPAQRTRLLDAMAEVERLMRAAAVTIEAADPSGAEAQACIQAYLDELQERLDDGFDPGRSVSADPDELVPPRGWFCLARLDGAPIGCGGVKIQDDGCGELKRMWVAPSARGLGIAQRLLAALEAWAAASGVDVLRLDTNRNLVEARALYVRNGYVEIPPYNSNPYAHYWFEKRGLRA